MTERSRCTVCDSHICTDKVHGLRELLDVVRAERDAARDELEAAHRECELHDAAADNTQKIAEEAARLFRLRIAELEAALETAKHYLETYHDDPECDREAIAAIDRALTGASGGEEGEGK